MRYGYHGIKALEAVLIEEAEKARDETLFRLYIGQAVWETNWALWQYGGAKYDKPQYAELIKPELAKEDKKSAAEIKQEMLEKLLR